MKRASYRDAIRWIAENDSAADDGALDPQTCGELVTAVLVAEIFEVDSDRVGRDIARARGAKIRRPRFCCFDDCDQPPKRGSKYCAGHHAQERAISTLLAERPNLTKYHTGGGCMALYHPCDDGGHVLLTSQDGGHLPEDGDDYVSCGRYDVDGNPCEEEGDDEDAVPAALVGEWLDAALKRGAAK